jgi:O-antigen/teichoic acid export membrane protein
MLRRMAHGRTPRDPEGRRAASASASPPEESADTSGSPLSHVRALARGTAVLVASGVVSYVGALLLNIVLARTLGVEGFGIWAVAFSVAMLLSTIGLLGADWIVMRQGSYFHGVGDLPRLRRTIHVALVLAGASLLVLGVALFVAAEAIADGLLHEPTMAPLLRLTGVIVPVMGVRQVLVYGTQAFKRMTDAALNRNILQPALRLAFVGAALLIRPSPLSAYVGLVVAEFVLLLTAAWMLDRRLPLFGAIDDVNTRELISGALPAWGSRLAGQSRAQIFPIILGALSTISSSAIFVAANRISIAPASIVNTMNQVFIVMASDLFLRNRRGEMSAVFKSCAKLSFVLGFPLFVIMVAFPRELLSLFGGSFESGSEALVVLAFGVLFQFGTGPVTVTLIVIGRPKLALLDYALVLVLEIALGLLLIPSLGVLGAAIARTAGTMLNNVLPLAQVWRIVGVSPFRLDFWKPVVAGVVAGIVASVALALADPAQEVVAAALVIASTALTYVPMLLLLRLSEQDRAMVNAVLRRGDQRRGDEATVMPDDVTR